LTFLMRGALHEGSTASDDPTRNSRTSGASRYRQPDAEHRNLCRTHHETSWQRRVTRSSGDIERSASRHREGFDRVECRTEVITLDLEVVASLQVDPEPFTRAEESSET